MKVLGLTGSIGMGKSATAQMFRDEDIPVYDADAAVHALYGQGGKAVGPLSERFDGIVEDGAINREALRAIVLGDDKAMADLEAIVHPLVAESQLLFRQKALEANRRLVVLDIPLLYETGGEERCDYVAVITAPASLQRERVLSRAGVSETDFEAILAKQMPDAEKRARADFILSSAFGFDFTRAHVRAIIDLFTSDSEGQTFD